MTSVDLPHHAPLLPVLDRRLVMTIVLAGLAADILWEGWARLITPLLVGGPLEPAALVQLVFGWQSRLAGEIVHALVGVIAYPVGYLFVARPLQRILLPKLPLLLTGLGFGVGLWIFALYVMAHLIGGLPAFLGFIPLTWASLVGHLIFGVTVAVVVAWREAAR